MDFRHSLLFVLPTSTLSAFLAVSTVLLPLCSRLRVPRPKLLLHARLVTHLTWTVPNPPAHRILVLPLVSELPVGTLTISVLWILALAVPSPLSPSPPKVPSTTYRQTPVALQAAQSGRGCEYLCAGRDPSSTPSELTGDLIVLWDAEYHSDETFGKYKCRTVFRGDRWVKVHHVPVYASSADAKGLLLLLPLLVRTCGPSTLEPLFSSLFFLTVSASVSDVPTVSPTSTSLLLLSWASVCVVILKSTVKGCTTPRALPLFALHLLCSKFPVHPHPTTSSLRLPLVTALLLLPTALR